MKKKVAFVGLTFAHEHYLCSHKQVLRNEYIVESIYVDRLGGDADGYKRRSLLRLPRDICAMYKAIRACNPNLLITVGPRAGFLVAIASLFVIRATHAHWFTGQVWAASRKPMTKLAWWLDFFLIKRVGVLFSDGHSQAKFLTNSFNISREIFQPKNGSINGLPIKYTAAKPAEFSRTNRKRVLFVGRLTKDKGLEIISLLAKGHSPAQSGYNFTIAGPIDETFTNFTEWSQGLPENVTLIAQAIDPLDFYKEADLLILPSKREGFGSVVIEAQSQGLPVIVSDIYGLRDSFQNETTGYACTTLQDYEAALHKLNSPATYAKMSQAAWAFAQRFEATRFFDDLRDCYRRAGLLTQSTLNQRES